MIYKLRLKDSMKHLYFLFHFISVIKFKVYKFILQINYIFQELLIPEKFFFQSLFQDQEDFELYFSCLQKIQIFFPFFVLIFLAYAFFLNQEVIQFGEFVYLLRQNY